jgi:hypothetical protein
MRTGGVRLHAWRQLFEFVELFAAFQNEFKKRRLSTENKFKFFLKQPSRKLITVQNNIATFLLVSLHNFKLAYNYIAPIGYSVSGQQESI